LGELTFPKFKDTLDYGGVCEESTKTI